MKALAPLIRKYNRPIPRYTSYPTVPFWSNSPNQDQWKAHVKNAFQKSNDKEGISIYIHLPFCESLCTYCGCNTRITVNHRVESPYIEALKKEFDLYIELFETKPIISELHLGGGTPTFFSPEHLESLINYLFERSEISENANMSFEAHPANTTYEHLETLYRLGFKRLSLGIQDFDEHVQTLINRHQTVEQVERVVLQARSIGYDSINFDLIYGLPDQTVDSVKNTVYEVIRLKPERIAFYSYAHVPWLKPGQRKYDESNLPSGNEKFKLYEEGRDMLEEAGYHEIGMDHFALSNDSLFTAMYRGSMHRNFMGYTERHTQLMIGLGVSSISDTFTCFAQNEKKLEDYYKRIDANEFPFFKGHQLSEDDLLRRKLILDLMCRQKAELKAEILNSSSIALLDEMMSDNMVAIVDNQLEITNTGKALLRNCCSIYDAYLDDEVKSTNMFSMAV
jgi:oxygen-independent coproporphyrinogen-3 oxidase